MSLSRAKILPFRIVASFGLISICASVCKRNVQGPVGGLLSAFRRHSHTQAVLPPAFNDEGLAAVAINETLLFVCPRDHVGRNGLFGRSITSQRRQQQGDE